MITALKFMEYMKGFPEANIFLIGVIFSTLFFITVFILFQRNRKTLKRTTTGILFMLLVVALCDYIWMQTLFPQGQYRNPGIGGIYMPLYLPILQFILLITLTLANRQNNH